MNNKRQGISPQFWKTKQHNTQLKIDNNKKSPQNLKQEIKDFLVLKQIQDANMYWH